ncbi:hypothetical protein VSS37_17750 [Candidatus Thiothrix sp. Deng01]|uniref:Uncharacterized protein n=1 Tax=Candidatus Thiothrix phosphatis TaxID=3112415 RepID=A0ABU6D177_9GAMM|nr:hypothetical protein [Candidatus Thiothrix sp. Deng01]MEB4592828.1 hypothetical protein [Candidatus Thiothrix sp. Deng01]
MEYIAQFVVMFLLSCSAAYSVRIWTSISSAVIGWIFIPLIIVLIIIGEGAGWHYVGYAMTWAISHITAAFQAIPVMMSGVLLGTLTGLGLLRK